MNIVKCIFLFICLSSQTFALNEFSVASKDMDTFVKKCPKLPSTEQMKSEISSLLKDRQKKPWPKWIERYRSLFGSPPPQNPMNKSVSLDGLKLSNINSYDLEVISRLTMHRDSTNPIWKSSYIIEQKQINGVTYINRKCLSMTCNKRGRNTPVNLSILNSKPTCSDALCAAQSIFGEEQGTKILWAYLKYGSNLSPFSNINADPFGFDNETLNAVLLAMNSVPEHLRETSLKDSGFYRFLKGESLAIYSDQPVVANAGGAVFDVIDEFNFSEKVYIFTHELGHRSSRLNKSYLAESDTWKKASGWQIEADGIPFNEQSRSMVSKYAMSNPSEDYAETYALYRFNPQRLKKVSPKRYQFMKEQVFKGIEYDQNVCQGQINTESAAIKTPIHPRSAQ